MATGMGTYFIDPSCGDDFEATFRRCQHWAQRAVERLNDPTDTDFARCFHVIFKTPKEDRELMPRSHNWLRVWANPRTSLPQNLTNEGTDPLPVVDHVRRDLQSFATEWQRTGNRAQAEVRIHVRDRRRYREQDIEERRGRRRHYHLLDGANWMVAGKGDNWAEEWNNVWDPKEDESIVPFAQTRLTTTESVIGTAPPNPHNINRTVIDFMDALWINGGPAVYDNLQLDEQPDLWSRGICRFGDITQRMVETTLIHEMMHTNRYRLMDIGQQERQRQGLPIQQTGGWEHVQGLRKNEAYNSAEALAQLCLCAAMADLPKLRSLSRLGGFTMARDWDRLHGDYEITATTPRVGTEWAAGDKWLTRFGDPFSRSGGIIDNETIAGNMVFLRDITGTNPAAEARPDWYRDVFCPAAETQWVQKSRARDAGAPWEGVVFPAAPVAALVPGDQDIAGFREWLTTVLRPLVEQEVDRLVAEEEEEPEPLVEFSDDDTDDDSDDD